MDMRWPVRRALCMLKSVLHASVSGGTTHGISTCNMYTSQGGDVDQVVELRCKFVVFLMLFLFGKTFLVQLYFLSVIVTRSLTFDIFM